MCLHLLDRIALTRRSLWVIGHRSPGEAPAEQDGLETQGPSGQGVGRGTRCWVFIPVHWEILGDENWRECKKGMNEIARVQLASG